MYLEPIFSSEDIMQQLPLEGGWWNKNFHNECLLPELVCYFADAPGGVVEVVSDVSQKNFHKRVFLGITHPDSMLLSRSPWKPCSAPSQTCCASVSCLQASGLLL
jgi:hypothetical protein